METGYYSIPTQAGSQAGYSQESRASAYSLAYSEYYSYSSMSVNSSVGNDGSCTTDDDCITGGICNNGYCQCPIGASKITGVKKSKSGANDNIQVCAPCPDDMQLKGGECVCPDDKVFDVVKNICLPCPDIMKGSIYNIETESCECPENKYILTDAFGSKHCSECDGENANLNRYQLEDGKICKCATGVYSASKGECVNCNKIIRNSRQDDESGECVCKDGYYAVQDTIERCVIGKCEKIAKKDEVKKEFENQSWWKFLFG
ncbi:MAG: EB domain-containing protein [Bdellovibrionota bacterium]